MKWGLALSGGALRGAAHIGILSVLEEEGLRPNYIAGTSSGSLVAALYALGFSASHMEEVIANLSVKKLYDLNISWGTLANLATNLVLWLLKSPPEFYRGLPTGLIKGVRLWEWINTIIMHRRFYDTHIPLAVMTTDINNGEAVCYHSPGLDLSRFRYSRRMILKDGNDLATPLRASTAIPGVFTPVELDGRTLVDGGVVDNLPSEVLKAMGAKRVLAVNLGYAGEQKKNLDNALAIASQALDIMAGELTKLRGVQAADLVINPRIYDVGLTDFNQLGECIVRGREAAKRALPEIRMLLG